MKRLVSVLAPVLAAFALTSVALGAAAGSTAYAGPKYWYPGEGGGSSFSASWWRNAFNKESSGYDTTVTFIDNVSYGWHATVRNTQQVTYTVWWSSQVKKGHCRANTGYFNGGCWIIN